MSPLAIFILGRKANQTVDNPVSTPTTLVANDNQHKSPDKAEKSIEKPIENEIVETVVAERPKSPVKPATPKKKAQSPSKKSTPKKCSISVISSQ